MQSNLSETIDILADKARYDASVKELLADKQILARILKYATDDFAKESIPEILELATNPLIAMLEELLQKDSSERKKKALSEQYGLILNESCGANPGHESLQRINI